MKFRTVRKAHQTLSKNIPANYFPLRELHVCVWLIFSSKYSHNIVFFFFLFLSNPHTLIKIRWAYGLSRPTVHQAQHFLFT
ncbi:hypothetical protein HanRHA438_Chr03g0130331 [Helianthus annuus]|nr:hypothetical protein HanRHA438_Chr03g0130331 [Helianthus annuus]